MSNLLNTTTRMADEISQFTFGITDYVLFVIMLSISAVIGVYFGFFAKGADTTDEYLMGSKRMKTIPIAISLVASQLSAISIMTIPAEMFTYGITWSLNVAAMVIIVPILNWVIIPVFYRNNITNCYEYLEIRFDRKTRQIQTIAFMITIFFMLPIFIFIPSLAFSQVTGYNVHVINIIVCSICTFYTMFGGIKAVVWTDVVQATIMVISVVLVGVLGTIKSGGVGEVLHKAAEGGRLDIDFTFDATTRATFWNVASSSTIMWISYVGFNQNCVQRIVSLPTLGHARRSLVLFGIGFIVIMAFNCFTGIVMYARYHDCDPLLAGFVQKADKLMPFFVQDVVGHLKGMPGVFISCVFSAALSTLSASLNSLAGVVYFDYIKPHIKHTEYRANLIMKAFVFAAGIYCIFGGMLVEKFSSILQVAYSIGGLSFGSVFGVFLLGMLVPRAHGKAAFISVVCSMVVMSIIVLRAQGRLHYEFLPATTEGCTTQLNTTTTTPISTTAYPKLSTPITEIQETPTDFNIFDMSFNWYATLGALITWIVALPLTYLMQPPPDAKFNPKLLSPIIQPFVKYELTQTEELPEILTKPNKT